MQRQDLEKFCSNPFILTVRLVNNKYALRAGLVRGSLHIQPTELDSSGISYYVVYFVIARILRPRICRSRGILTSSHWSGQRQMSSI